MVDILKFLQKSAKAFKMFNVLKILKMVLPSDMKFPRISNISGLGYGGCQITSEKLPIFAPVGYPVVFSLARVRVTADGAL